MYLSLVTENEENSNLLFCVIIDMINSILFLSEYAYINAVYEELQVINNVACCTYYSIYSSLLTETS